MVLEASPLMASVKPVVSPSRKVVSSSVVVCWRRAASASSWASDSAAARPTRQAGGPSVQDRPNLLELLVGRPVNVQDALPGVHFVDDAGILLDVDGRLGALLVGQQVVHLLLDVVQSDLSLGDGN
ncbi:hypothetical protein HUK64_15320 [Pseudomonas aeruginosa]|nr:hypothetical protein [Pseudomonas aeruginosa]QQD35208.1 hypothetical protein HUF09_25250 [Pseudomonas aeruginosa]UJB86719.1 hypothetical protein HUK64_15320 [Pseudomonas aeruginosa]